MKKEKTIVVVDDDRCMGDLLEQVLSTHFKVKLFASGMEALTWLSDGNETDLILTDLVMPGVNGLERVDHVRQPLPLLIAFGKHLQLLRPIIYAREANAHQAQRGSHRSLQKGSD